MTTDELRIVVAAGTFADCAVESEAVRGKAVVCMQHIESPAEVAAATRDADALIVTIHRLSADHLDALGPKVRIIGRSGIGLDAIDLDHARARGLAVYHEPGYATEEVATHALAMMFAANRRLLVADRTARTAWSDWPSIGPVRALSELTVGLVGCGRIGGAVARGILPFVHEVLVYDPALSESPSGATLVATLDDLLQRSNIVSLHLPVTATTEGIIGRRELALMPHGSILVNVSRGRLVDEGALVEALEAGQLATAALDVQATEPPAADAPILRAPNTILSPHFGWYSVDAAQRVRVRTVTSMVEFLRGQEPAIGRLAVRPEGWEAIRSR